MIMARLEFCSVFSVDASVSSRLWLLRMSDDQLCFWMAFSSHLPFA